MMDRVLRWPRAKWWVIPTEHKQIVSRQTSLLSPLPAPQLFGANNRPLCYPNNGAVPVQIYGRMGYPREKGVSKQLDTHGPVPQTSLTSSGGACPPSPSPKAMAATRGAVCWRSRGHRFRVCRDIFQFPHFLKKSEDGFRASDGCSTASAAAPITAWKRLLAALGVALAGGADEGPGLCFTPRHLTPSLGEWGGPGRSSPRSRQEPPCRFFLAGPRILPIDPMGLPSRAPQGPCRPPLRRRDGGGRGPLP